MKIFFTLCLLLSIQDISAQDIIMPTKDGKIVFEFIHDSIGKSKIDIYTAAKVWFVAAFNSSNDVLQMDDKENGLLIGKGIFYIYSTGLGASRWPCYFTVSITAKDNKYLAEFINFSYGEGKFIVESLYEQYKKGKMKKSIGFMLTEIKETVFILASSLREQMTKKPRDF
jgi:hypothetical protein